MGADDDLQKKYFPLVNLGENEEVIDEVEMQVHTPAWLCFIFCYVPTITRYMILTSKRLVYVEKAHHGSNTEKYDSVVSFPLEQLRYIGHGYSHFSNCCITSRPENNIAFVFQGYPFGIPFPVNSTTGLLLQDEINSTHQASGAVNGLMSAGGGPPFIILIIHAMLNYIVYFTATMGKLIHMFLAAFGCSRTLLDALLATPWITRGYAGRNTLYIGIESMNGTECYERATKFIDNVQKTYSKLVVHEHTPSKSNKQRKANLVDSLTTSYHNGDNFEDMEFSRTKIPLFEGEEIVDHLVGRPTISLMDWIQVFGTFGFYYFAIVKQKLKIESVVVITTHRIMYIKSYADNAAEGFKCKNYDHLVSSFLLREPVQWGWVYTPRGTGDSCLQCCCSSFEPTTFVKFYFGVAGYETAFFFVEGKKREEVVDFFSNLMRIRTREDFKKLPQLSSSTTPCPEVIQSQLNPLLGEGESHVATLEGHHLNDKFPCECCTPPFRYEWHLALTSSKLYKFQSLFQKGCCGCTESKKYDFTVFYNVRDVSGIAGIDYQTTRCCRAPLPWNGGFSVQSGNVYGGTSINFQYRGDIGIHHGVFAYPHDRQPEGYKNYEPFMKAFIALQNNANNKDPTMMV